MTGAMTDADNTQVNILKLIDLFEQHGLVIL